MNFFQHQDSAKKKTSLLVLLLLCAVAALIIITVFALAAVLFFTGNHATSVHAAEAYNTSYSEHLKIMYTSPITLYIAIGVILVVGGASIFKLSQLSKGGSSIAVALGGYLIQPDSQDPDERKVLNVVEEMALASGNPVPLVYVLEEQGINAFAAGNGRRDAVIGITRGAINSFTRDEVQGVIAHEFSHIHNGDMRLNMRIIAILHGILVLGLIGDVIWRSTYYSAGSSFTRRRESRKNTGPILSAAIALWVIGYAGTFFGNIIKAAVSRQREFLADASAVQFTRNPSGISNALKKIGGNSSKAFIQHAASNQFSHMFFGSNLKNTFLNIFATHPPLADRIKRIEPNWDGQFIAPSNDRQPSHVESMSPGEANLSQPEAAFMAAAAAAVQASGHTAYSGTTAEEEQAKRLPDIEFTLESATELDEPTEQNLAHAEQLLASLPKVVHDACHEPFSARALIYCLVLDTDPAQRNEQLTYLKGHAAVQTFREVARLRPLFSKLAPELYLSIVDLCIPALKQQSAPQLKRFIENLSALIKADGKITLYEWCIYRIILQNLKEQNPKEHFSLNSQKAAAKTLIEVLAGLSEHTPPNKAFVKGWAALGLQSTASYSEHTFSPKKMEVAIRALAQLKPLEKPKLLKGLATTILADNHVSPAEAELYRAIADLLNCPVPPLTRLKDTK